MFCVNCGKPVEGDASLCPECMAAQQPVESAPEPQPALDLNLSGEAPTETKKSSKKGKKIFLICVSAVLLLALAVALVGFLFLDWGSKAGFFWAKLTKDDKGAALYVEEKALNGGGASLSSYGQLFGNLSASAGEASQQMQTTVTLELGDACTEVLADSLDAEDEAELAELIQALDSIQLVSSTTEGEDVSQIDLSLGLNDIQILTLQTIFDYPEATAYVGIPEANNTFLGADASEIALDLEQLQQELSVYQQTDSAVLANTLSQKDIQTLIKKYGMLIFSNIDSVKETTETVEIDDIKQEFTVYTYTIDEATAQKIALAVLKEAKKDETILQLAESYYNYTNQLYATYYEDDFSDFSGFDADEFIESLEALEEILAESELDSDTVLFAMKTYADSTGKVCGRVILDDRDKEVFLYRTTTKNGKTGFEISVGGKSGLSVIGSGKKSNGKLTGTYQLRISMLTVAWADLQNFDTENAIGTIRIRPSKLVQRELFSMLEESDSMLSDFADFSFALELVLEENGLTIHLLDDDELLISLGIATQTIPSQTVEIPESVILLQEDEDLIRWAEEIDLGPILDRLEDADAPESILSLLRELDIAQLLTEEAEEAPVSDESESSEDVDDSFMEEDLSTSLEDLLPAAA